MFDFAPCLATMRYATPRYTVLHHATPPQPCHVKSMVVMEPTFLAALGKRAACLFSPLRPANGP